MLTGGIPYYLERIDKSKGFIRGINDAFFTANSNLLGELDEMLDLEFNKLGKKAVVKILGSLGQQGKGVKQICEFTGLAKSSVSQVLEKLLTYKIISIKEPNLFSPKEQYGSRYFIEDLFLNAYFEIFEKQKRNIETNVRGLIFPSSTQLSLSGYYIPNFTGQAFENFLRYILSNRFKDLSKLYDELLIKNDDFEIKDFWNEKTQVDLVVYSKLDRLIRTIECKWAKWDPAFISQARKNLPIPATSKGTFVKNYLLCSSGIPTAAKKEMRKNEMGFLELETVYD